MNKRSRDILFPAPAGTIIMLLAFCMSLPAMQGQQKRSRAEGMYQCVSANTTGRLNWWITGRAIGFLWDNPDENGSPNFYPFPEIQSEFGLINFASIGFEMRPVSYPEPVKKPLVERLQMGNMGASAKFTMPNNKDMRYHGLGIQVKYFYNFINRFASIAGYRMDNGTGFCAEGFMHGEHNLEMKLLYDRDYLARYSMLPFKIMVNLGLRMPFDDQFLPYSQYLFDIGIIYAGLNADVFCEFSYEGFVNNSFKPKKFDINWASGYRVSEVAFSENPMYLTLGGRIRYDNGMVLYAAVPLLLSSNQGSDITYKGDWQRLHNDFPDEKVRGIKDPFDPWYAKWKIVAQLSFPIMYRQTGAEMRRRFLLLKNRKGGRKIDIDERLKMLENSKKSDRKKEEETEDEERKKKKRLEEIQRRKNEILKEKEAE
ncbi:MAG: hypothetical protein GF401_07235 [Chitinivibrionales bacterium]|nr:hypothetical protein [Chitinivibrionales bacterium]